MVEQLIIEALLADGPPGYPTTAEDRVYAVLLPQGSELPAVTYQRVASTPVNSLSGSSGLDYVRMQVDCWARTYDQVKRLAEDVRTVMEAASFKALLASDRDEYEPETKLYRASSDYLLWQK